MISLERGELFPRNPQVAKVFIATVQEDLMYEAIKLAQKLRNDGVSCEVDMKGRSVGKQLEYANVVKIPYVIVLGQRELGAGRVKIREMSTGRELETSLMEIGSKIQALSG